MAKGFHEAQDPRTGVPSPDPGEHRLTGCQVELGADQCVDGRDCIGAPGLRSPGDRSDVGQIRSDLDPQ